MLNGFHIAEKGQTLKGPLPRDRPRPAHVLPLAVFAVIAVAFAIGRPINLNRAKL